MRGSTSRRWGADDGEREQVRLGLVVCGLGQGGDDLVEEIAGAMAMGRGERARLADAEGVEVPKAVLLGGGVVLLVHDEEDGLVLPAQDAGDLLVLVGHAGRAVHHEDDDVGLLAGEKRLLTNARGEDVLRLRGLDAARVDQREVAAVPVGVVIGAVPRDAARLVHDGVTAHRDAVHQRGLADVRPADHGDYGFGHLFSSLFDSPAQLTTSG